MEVQPKTIKDNFINYVHEADGGIISLIDLLLPEIMDFVERWRGESEVSEHWLKLHNSLQRWTKGLRRISRDRRTDL